MSSSSNTWWYIVGTIVAIGLLFFIGFIIYRIKNQKKVSRGNHRTQISTIEKIYSRERQSPEAVSQYQNMIVELSTKQNELNPQITNSIQNNPYKLTHIDSNREITTEAQNQQIKSISKKNGHENPSFQIDETNISREKVTQYKFSGEKHKDERNNIDLTQCATIDNPQRSQKQKQDTVTPRPVPAPRQNEADETLLINNSGKYRTENVKDILERNVSSRRTISETPSLHPRNEKSNVPALARASSEIKKDPVYPVAPRRKRRPRNQNTLAEAEETSSYEPSIPNPDYTLRRKKTSEKISVESIVVVKPREFRGPYGIEDLDEMNNPYTWGKKPQIVRPSLVKNDEWF